MKKLVITGMDGVRVSETLVDVKGENFTLDLTIPLFLPIVNISLLEPEKKEVKRTREIMRRVKAMVTP